MRPTVGGSIASFLCTQDLTLSEEAWQREKSRCMGSSCHQLSWLSWLQFLTSAVVTVFLYSGREQLDRNRRKNLVYRGAREQTQIYLKECSFKKAFGTGRYVGTRRCQVWPRPWNEHPVPCRKWNLREALPIALLPSIMWQRPGGTFYPFYPRVASLW